MTLTNDSGPVSAHPVQPVERFISRKELAAIMGVSLGTIDNLTREGMPSATWGKRTRRFQASVAIAWAQARG